MSNDNYIFREKRVSERAPLFVVFHGTGGDENQFFDLASSLLPNANIIAPRGDVSEHGAARFFRRTSEGVYDMSDLQKRTHAMCEFVEAHRQRLHAPKVIGLGYSNGANILASITFSQPDLFDEVVLMHPLIPWHPQRHPGLSKLGVLITAGRNDPICPPTQTQRLADFYANQTRRASLEWHSGGHELRPNETQAAARFLASDLTIPKA